MEKVKIKNNLGEEVEVTQEFAKAFKEVQGYSDKLSKDHIRKHKIAEDIEIEDY
jgi:hypothetical protein